METGKPLIAILMAVYEPRMDWLREQLLSLEGQTYPNMRLYVRDDCSPTVPFEEIEKCVAECVRSFPCEVWRNEENLGSNKTFERLTEEAEGEYFAYCDQDDVWHCDKLQMMTEVLEQTGSPLVCSDLDIINDRGEIVANSITKIRRRHIFQEGNGLAPSLLISNFVAGCAMMIKADIAKNAIPFVDSLVHDQWLAINAALCGRIEVIRKPLVDYRQHRNNQTGILSGINSKEDYYQMRIENMRRRIIDYKSRLGNYNEIQQTVFALEELNEARSRYFYKQSSSDRKLMKKHRDFMKQAVRFEVIMPFLPDGIVKMIFRLIRSGAI